MDRRRALQMLAATGVGAAGSTIVSDPAFADGGSPIGDRPILQGGAPLLAITFIARQSPGVVISGVSVNFSVLCQPGGTSQGYQWRVSQISGLIVNFTLPGGAPAGVWFTAPSSFGLSLAASSGNFNGTGAYSFRIEQRTVCCYGSRATWRCLQAVGNFTVAAGNENGSPTNTSFVYTSGGSLNCENPPPTCP